MKRDFKSLRGQIPPDIQQMRNQGKGKKRIRTKLLLFEKKEGTPNDIETNFSALNHRHPSTEDSLGKTLKWTRNTKLHWLYAEAGRWVVQFRHSLLVASTLLLDYHFRWSQNLSNFLIYHHINQWQTLKRLIGNTFSILISILYNNKPENHLSSWLGRFPADRISIWFVAYNRWGNKSFKNQKKPKGNHSLKTTKLVVESCVFFFFDIDGGPRVSGT